MVGARAGVLIKVALHLARSSLLSITATLHEARCWRQFWSNAQAVREGSAVYFARNKS